MGYLIVSAYYKESGSDPVAGQARGNKTYEDGACNAGSDCHIAMIRRCGAESRAPDAARNSNPSLSSAVTVWMTLLGLATTLASQLEERPAPTAQPIPE